MNMKKRKELMKLIEELIAEDDLIIWDSTQTVNVLYSGDDIGSVCMNGTAIQIELKTEII